jgi:hypothetical protein
MKRTEKAFVAGIMSLMLVGFGGCGDDDKNGGSGGGGGGVTAPEGGAAIDQSNIAATQAAVLGSALGVASKGPGTHDGAHSGKVKIDVATSKAAQAPTILYNMKFTNYSDDGQIVLDGTIRYEFSGATFSIQGDIELSGTYEGDLEIDITSNNGAVSGSISVDGTRYAFP